MKRKKGLNIIALCVIFLMFSSGGIVGAFGFLPTLFAEAENYPPPPWLNEGTRLTYYSISGSIPHDKYRYFDGEGNFVDRDGNRWKQEEHTGTAGQALNVTDVVAMDQGEVVLSKRSHLIIGETILPPQLVPARTGSVGFVNELWVHPGFLATIQEGIVPGLKIIRAPYTLGGITFNAIRFQVETENSLYVQVYDVETGILLHMGFSGISTGSGITIHGTPSQVTQIIQGYLVDVRQLDIPWSHGLLSPVSHNTSMLQYDGYYSSSITFIRVAKQQFYQTETISSRWLSQKRVTITQGSEAFPSEVKVVCGVAQIGGTFIPPVALSILTEGQIIDYDPVTGVQVMVFFNGTTPQGQRLLGIRETARDFSFDYYYNQDGVLIGMQLSEKPNRWANDETQVNNEYWLSYMQ